MQNATRRDFLKTTSTAVVAGATIFAAPAISRSRDTANDRIRVAVIGVGGRGDCHWTSLLEIAKEGGKIEVAAICDCDENRMKGSADMVEKATGHRPATPYDQRKIFDDPSIDAVSLATPNHWHALETVWACQAGKDVYVEKPASHNIFEGRKMVEAARKYNRIVQCGTQCRSSGQIREGVQKLKEGVIGRVYMARAVVYKVRAGGKNKIGPPPKGMHWDLWLGPGPKADYNQLLVFRWRFMKDYGNGELGDQGVHQLDIIRWALELKTHPNRVQSMGGNLVHDDDEDTPSNQLATYQWADRRLLVQAETREWYTNSEAGMGVEFPFVDHANVVGNIFLGTHGYMIMPDYSSYYVFLDRDRKPGPHGSVPGNPMMDTDHFRNWVSAMRSRKASDLYAEIEDGHLSAVLPHLANIAYRTGRTLNFDPKTERFINDAESDKLLTRPARPPFVVPEKV